MAIYLHYVGERWYTDEQFIKEGKEMRVQRLTSFTMAKKLFKEEAIVYYARYDKERRYARVFAVGKVIGIGSTMPYLRKLVKENTVYTYENRRCGTCFSTVVFMSHKELADMLYNIDEKEARRYRWFTITDIEPYQSSIDNVIEYKVKKKQIIIKDIQFTRGFINIGGGSSEKEAKYILKIIKMHRLRDNKYYDDVRYTVDTSRYTQLDNWLGGGISC
jgi:hypothetical protein